MLWMLRLLQFLKQTETELVEQEDNEAYDTVLPPYVVSITLKRIKKKGFKQIHCARVDHKEKVSGIPT